MTKLEEKLKDVLVEVLLLEEEEVTRMRDEKQSLSTFMIDSYGLFELGYALDAKFDITIPSCELTTDSTFEDLLNVIKILTNEEE